MNMIFRFEGQITSMDNKIPLAPVESGNNMAKHMTFKQSVLFVIVITNVVLITMQSVHGQRSMSMAPELVEEINRLPELEIILNNSYQHADSPNAVQDLINKGILDYNYTSGITCAEIKQMRDTVIMHS